MRKSTFVLSVMGLAAFAAVSSVEAASVGGHPALGNAFILKATIDPDTFIAGHPAGGTSVRGHANHEHPAVVASRAAPQGVDVNTFLVQPPAATQWTLAPVPTAVVSLAR
jgi:hypothetical protein